MKKTGLITFLLISVLMFSCNSNTTQESETTSADNSVIAGGQENVQDEVSQKNIVKIALGAPDHSTLVAALRQAGLISSLSNAGPFTVFAPTNEAFKNLPTGTVEDLIKDANKDKLINILQYHVFVSSLQPNFLNSEQTFNMVNGDDLKITSVDDKPVLNGQAHVLSSIPASNGMIYVIDNVLLPPGK